MSAHFRDELKLQYFLQWVLWPSFRLQLLCARWYFSHSQTSECYARWFFFIVIVTLMLFPYILVPFNSFWRGCFIDELHWGPVLGREVFERMMMWGYRAWWVLIVSFAMFNTIPSLKWWVKTIQTRVSESHELDALHISVNPLILLPTIPFLVDLLTHSFIHSSPSALQA